MKIDFKGFLLSFILSFFFISARFSAAGLSGTTAKFCLGGPVFEKFNSPDSYLKLIKSIDRNQFGVHLDRVNLVTSPQIY